MTCMIGGANTTKQEAVKRVRKRMFDVMEDITNYSEFTSNQTALKSKHRLEKNATQETQNSIVAQG